MRTTATQRKILGLLSDGKPHPREQVRDCLPDYLSDYRALNTHLVNIRRNLRTKGEDIVCVFFQRRIYYQHVILLPLSENTRDEALTKTELHS